MLPLLRLQFEKRVDGTLIFRCVRRDGSVTWQRGNTGKAQFFAEHDLTHFVVESELQHRRGFYGLVADGWDLTDFEAPWPRGRMPADMDGSEIIVGMLDRERASGATWSAEEFNASVQQWFANSGSVWVWRDLSDAELVRIRARLAELVTEWQALPPGKMMELDFACAGHE